MLNRSSSVSDDAIDRLPQIECDVLLDVFPMVMGTRKAIQHLSPYKAPGADAIPAEVYKAGGLQMAEKLTVVSMDVEDGGYPTRIQGCIHNPSVQRKSVTTTVASLLSIAEKILAKRLLTLLNVHLDQAGLILESQCGFRKDRGTIDMIFTARQLQEKCQEQM